MLNLDLSYVSYRFEGCLDLNPTQPHPGSQCLLRADGAYCAYQCKNRGKVDKVRKIETSGCFVLACRGCQERTVLLGATDDWHAEGGASFECGGCGRHMTLANRVGEVYLEDAAGLAPSPRR